jgi:hypothetical protein
MNNVNAKSLHYIYVFISARMSRFLLYLKTESEETEMLQDSNFDLYQPLLQKC